MSRFFDDPRFKGIEPFETKIWLSSPTMHGDEQHWVDEAIKTNWVSTVGANINEVERQIAEFTGMKYAVALSAGTAALHLATKLAGEKDVFRVDRKPQTTFCWQMATWGLSPKRDWRWWEGNHAEHGNPLSLPRRTSRLPHGRRAIRPSLKPPELRTDPRGAPLHTTCGFLWQHSHRRCAGKRCLREGLAQTGVSHARQPAHSSLCSTFQLPSLLFQP